MPRPLPSSGALGLLAGLVGTVLPLVATLGCSPAKPTTPPPETPHQPAANPYTDLARAIDPGPQPPLLTQAPAWMAAIARPPPAFANNPELEAHAKGLLEAWNNRKGASPLMQVDALLGLLSAIGAGEQLLANGTIPGPEVLSLLERAYAMFDIPGANKPGSFLRQTFETMMMAANRSEALTEQSQVAAGIKFFDTLLTQAPLQRRHVAALLLQHYPDSAGVPDALQRIAGDFAHQGNYTKALELHQQALKLLGDGAKFRQWSSYARACMQALEPSLARTAIDNAAAVPIPEGQADDRKTGLDNLEQTHQALLLYDQLGPSTDPAKEARRGELLLLIGRNDRVGEQLKNLHQQYPQDARVWVLQAQYELNHNLDFAAAAAAIDRARPLSPHNETYYEVALGTIAGVFMGDFLPKFIADPASGKPVLEQALDRLQADIKGYAALRPDRAAILGAVVTRFRERLPASDTETDSDTWGRELVTHMLAPAAELRTKFPNSADVARFAILSSRFTSDQEAAFAQATAPLSASIPERDELVKLQQKTLLDLAVTWQNPTQLGNLCEQTLASKAPVKMEDRMVYGDILALCAIHTGRKAAAKPAADAYAEIVASGPTEMRLVALNNLGVLMALDGERAQAQEQFKAGVNHFPGKAAIVLLNLAEVSAPTEQIGVLLAVASNKPSTQAEEVAWTRLRARLAPGSEDLKTVDTRLAELRAKGPGLLPRVVDGSWGVLLSGTFDLGLTYSVRARLQLNLAVASQQWLLLPSSVPTASP